MRGMCTLPELKTMRLGEIADMNEAIDLQDAVQRLAAKRSKAKH